MQQQYLTQEQRKQKTTKTILTMAASVIFLGLAAWSIYALSLQEVTPSYLAPTVSEVSVDEYVLGNRDAVTTLVEYGDFQCPACSAYAAYLSQLHEDFPNDLRIVFRHFPLPQHQNAVAASVAAEAAGLQGKFWEMAELLYEDQSSWAAASSPESMFVDYATRMGLDVERFNRDSASSQLRAKVLAHKQSGDEAGVNSTPTFFLNSVKVANPSTYQQFHDMVTQAVQ